MTSPERPFEKPKWTDHLPRRPWQLAVIALIGLFVTGVITAALVALILTPTLPSVDRLNDNPLKVPLRVYTAEGSLIAEFGEEKRIPVTIDQVPDLLVKAILAAEDDSFYYHQGVDFQGILRAAWKNWRSGTTSEGASTITMQVARNYFLSPEKTYTRKLKEVLLAFKIERELSKDEILELYINKIYLGNRAYGFAAAAQIYYGKALNELTLPEMAMLAGLPKAPSRNNPVANPDSAVQRRGYVLRRMHKLKHIDDVAFQEAMAAPLAGNKHQIRFGIDAPYVAEMARQYMFQTHAESSYAEGYSVYTTIRTKEQQAAQEALRKGILDYDRRHGYRGPVAREKIAADTETQRLDEILKDHALVGPLQPGIVTAVRDKAASVYLQTGMQAEIEWEGLSWASRYINEDAQGPAPQNAADVVRVGDVIYVQGSAEDGWQLAQIPKVSGALVSLDPNTGAIVALAGGFDFYQSKFNRAIQAERQPGSSIKPFVFSAALEKGFTAASLVSGAPIVIQDVSLEDEWKPEDYSRQFYGPTRLRKALSLSLNLVAVRLLRAIGPESAVEHMAKFGFDPGKLPRNLSLVLGTASATPLQMTSAFAVLANGGYRIEPYFITRIEDSSGKVVEVSNPAVVCANADAVALARSEALQQACQKDGKRPQVAAKPSAVKTAGAGATAQELPVAPPRMAERVIPAENAFIMTSMLRDVITAGTGRGALVLERRDLAGKTGTTNDHRDAWFCGYNANLVTTAWIGFDQPAPLGRGEVGGRTALPMWIDYMRVAVTELPERPLYQPSGVTTAYVNRETGRLTEPGDPEGMPEYFIHGTVNQEPSSIEGTVPGSVAPDNVREGLF